MSEFRTRGHAVLSGGLGLELVAFSVRTNVAAAPDRIRDGGANAVASVTWTSAGKFTVQLNKPYPRQLVAGIASVDKAGASTSGVHVNVNRDSYSATTGQLVLETIVDDNTNAIENLADDDVLNFIGVFQTVNLLVQP